jgi:tetratricopeptide (TPR) repeat protein
VERIEKLKMFIANDPTDFFSRHALAMEFIKVGQLNSAIQEMEMIVQLDEKQVGTYYHLGKTYEKLSLFEKAILVYEKGIQIASELHKQHELRELKGALNLLNDELL